VAIEIANRQRLIPIDRRGLARLVSGVLAAVDRRNPVPEDVDLTVAFVRDKAIRDLNRQYRGKDRETDVLSFPARSKLTSRGYLGDIVISADTALRQASEGRRTVTREVSELVIHGVLHLCGYDHEIDSGEMDRLELRLRRKLLDRHRRSGG